MRTAQSVRGASTCVVSTTHARGNHAGSKTSSCRPLMSLLRALATWWRRCGMDLWCGGGTRTALSVVWQCLCQSVAAAKVHRRNTRGRRSDSDAGNACGNSETNRNTAGRDDVWVCGRLRRSKRIRMLQNIKNTICKDTGGADMTIWVEDSLTMRHIRLALEDNCTSCTRHPNLTIDGGAHSLTPALETDFATCCL